MLTLVNNTVAFDWASNSPRTSENSPKKANSKYYVAVDKNTSILAKKSINVNTTVSSVCKNDHI